MLNLYFLKLGTSICVRVGVYTFHIITENVCYSIYSSIYAILVL